MKRILSFSVWLAWILASPLVLAQRVGHGATSNIDVRAPSNFVLAARTLQLTARATNVFGATLRGKTMAWQTSDPTRASIDNGGLLRGLMPGAVNVIATDTDSGVAGAITVYVYPAGVSISTGSVSLQVGDTLTLTARAQDADGNPLPGVSFAWFTDLTAVARVSASGVLTGVSEGRVTVTASLDMGAAFERFTAFKTIEVNRRADFRLKTLLSSDSTVTGVTTLVPTHVSAAGNFVAGLIGLSNGGQAVVLSQGGRPQTIFAAGNALAGRIVTRFEVVSVNAQGDVAAFTDMQGEWCDQQIVLFTAASKWTPQAIDNSARCGYGLQPSSLDKQGGLAYRYGSTLYYRKPDGTQQAIVSIGDHPSGIDRVSNINNWSATPFGKVLVELQSAAGFSVYFAWDGAQLKKLFGAGDQIGANPSQWARLPVEVSPGEYITRIGGSYWSSISRLKDGTWSTVAINGKDNLGWVQDGFDGADGFIFFFADTNAGTALMRKNGSSTDVLRTFASWREISQISATGGDSAVAYGTFSGPVPIATRFRGTSSSTVLGPGLAVDGAFSMALAQGSILKGINPSGTILRTYGDTLLRVTPSGIATLLKPGDPLPGGSLASLGGLSGNRLGDFAFTAQHGAKIALFAYRNGQFQILADSDDLIDGAQIYGFPTYTDSLVAINNQGHVAAFTNIASGSGIYLYSTNASSAKNVIRLSAGAIGINGTFTGVVQIAIDDNDRVAFIANLSTGKTGVFLWDRGNLRELLETGQTDPSGRAYQYLQNLQAGGTRFYLRENSVGLNQSLVLDGATAKVLVADGFVTTFGVAINNSFGPEVAANSRGDAVYPVLTSSGAALLVKRADGTDALVAIGSLRGPDGEWFLNIYGAGIGEQGDIVFSALGWVSGHPRLALYQATPSSN